MIVDLFELLAKRPIVHPSTLKSASFRSAPFQEGELILEVTGYPWWIGAEFHETGTVRLAFTGLTDGNAFLPIFFDEDETEFLEDLSIAATAALSWMPSELSSIYCSQPIPEPLRIYGLVQKYLMESGSRRAFEDILNGGFPLHKFLEHASSDAFLLTTAPEDLTSLVATELDRQGVAFTTQTCRTHPQARWYVSFGHTWFFCETATAAWE